MSNLIPFQFEGTSIRVVTDEHGEPLFVGKDVCEALGFTNPSDAMNTHCRGVAKRYPIVDSLGRTQEARVLTEPDVLRLIVNCTLPAAEEFERLVFEEILPTIRRTGSYTHEKAKPSDSTRQPSRNQVAAAILLLRAAAEDLKLAPSAVLGGYQKIEAHLGIVGLLPNYATDAPNDSGAGSSEVAKPVGQLLEEFGVSMSAVAFNRLLVQSGFLVEMERKSTNGTKRYKSVANLAFGKNATHPNNQKETQPLWYASRFQELLARTLPKKPEAAA